MSGDLKKLAEAVIAGPRSIDDVGLLYVRTGPLERVGLAIMVTSDEREAEFLKAATPAAILGLYEEIDRLRDLLRRGAQPIHWERSQGYDLDAIRAHAQTTETYKHGDTLLMLVNEGDYLHRVIWESEVAEALSASTRAVETQDEHTVEVRG